MVSSSQIRFSPSPIRLLNRETAIWLFVEGRIPACKLVRQEARPWQSAIRSLLGHLLLPGPSAGLVSGLAIDRLATQGGLWQQAVISSGERWHLFLDWFTRSGSTV